MAGNKQISDEAHKRSTKSKVAASAIIGLSACLAGTGLYRLGQSNPDISRNKPLVEAPAAGAPKTEDPASNAKEQKDNPAEEKLLNAQLFPGPVIEVPVAVVDVVMNNKCQLVRFCMVEGKTASATIVPITVSNKAHAPPEKDADNKFSVTLPPGCLLSLACPGKPIQTIEVSQEVTIEGKAGSTNAPSE